MHLRWRAALGALAVKQVLLSAYAGTEKPFACMDCDEHGDSRAFLARRTGMGREGCRCEGKGLLKREPLREKQKFLLALNGIALKQTEALDIRVLAAEV